MNILSEKMKLAPKAALTGGQEMAARFKDTINLSIGDPDIKTPEVILDEAYRDIKVGNYTGYSPGNGYVELRDEICRFYKEEYAADIKREEVSVITGAGYGMYCAMAAVLNPGDEVILFEPFFTPYMTQVALAGGVCKSVATYEHEGFQINFDRLEQAVSPKTRGVLINSPCNPTGAAFERETLEKLRDFVIKHDLVVFADDIYTAFTFGQKFIPIMSLEGMFERTITVNSFSKNFVMTGMRIANIVAPAYVLESISKANDALVYAPPAYSQRAAIAALRNRGAVVEEIVGKFKERIDYGVSRIGKIKNMSILPPKGTFYLFPNIKATGLTSEQVAKELYEKAHIMVAPGSSFGPCGEGHIRICATVEISVLKEVFDRIEAMDIFGKI